MDVTNESREEMMQQAKKFMEYYKEFESVIIPVLTKFVVKCKKHNLAVKLNNVIINCGLLYRDLNDIYKTKSWVPLDELEEKVVQFEKYLDVIQKEYIILTRGKNNSI